MADETGSAGVASRYRAAVIGCGRIGSRWTGESRIPGVHSHAQAYREHPRTILVGVSDSNSERLAEAARLWNVEYHADPVVLCRRLRPDLVSICTPSETHYSLAEILLLETPPRVLFIEKPLALRVKEAERLVELADQVGCALAVNYTRRYSPAFQVLQQELQAGRHGRPLLVRILYGKGIVHNGTHAIDLLRYWIGEPSMAKGTPAAWGPEGDETYTADLWFENRCRARLEAFDERAATVFELDFLTERSRWRFWDGGNQWEFSEVADSPAYAGYRTYVPTRREQTDPLFSRPLATCLHHAVGNLVDFLESTAPLLCTGRDGLAALQWAERIRGNG